MVEINIWFYIWRSMCKSMVVNPIQGLIEGVIWFVDICSPFHGYSSTTTPKTHFQKKKTHLSDEKIHTQSPSWIQNHKPGQQSLNNTVSQHTAHNNVSYPPGLKGNRSESQRREPHIRGGKKPGCGCPYSASATEGALLATSKQVNRSFAELGAQV